MRHCLLLVCAVSVVAAAGVRPLVKFELLDVGFGPTSRLLSGSEDPRIILPYTCLGVAVGIMGGNRLGAAVGTAALEGNYMQDVSFLPVCGCLFYDLSPRRPWRRGLAFLSATYVHSGQDGWFGGQFGPYLKLAAGASYTYYAATVHAELGYDWHWQMATLTAGVGLGGVHVFR